MKSNNFKKVQQLCENPDQFATQHLLKKKNHFKSTVRALLKPLIKDGLTSLHIAIIQKDIERVKTLSRNSNYVNTGMKCPILLYKNCRKRHFLPLHLSGILGSLEITQILLEQGADVNAKSKEGWTALNEAVQKNDLKMAKLLVSYGANLNAQLDSPLGKTTLHIAVKYGNKEMVKMLLENGAEIDAIFSRPETPLYHSLFYNKKENFETLVKFGANVNHIIPPNGNSLLHYAIKKNKLDFAEILLLNGASIETESKNGWTPLHIASKYSNETFVKMLIQKGAKINSKTNAKKTPLAISLLNEKLENFKTLIDMGAKVNSIEGYSLLYHATMNDKLHFAEVLLKNGVNTEDRSGVSLIHYAIKNDKIEMVKMLVNSNPSNTHSKDNFGRTPLYKAASENKLEIAKFLLKNGANIHYTAKFETILHTATKFGDETFVKMLIIAGADVDKQCHLSMTPLCNAIYYDKEANAKMLINYGAIRGQAPDSEGGE